ncbi:hypothetical protein H4219_002473 [Mycoemilia scoparia]|uniref:Uncharacterized protein n=1 Tax=Mycoemilia scoparia TaxID=417184 RepID=A0A9W8A393_9FUNG|nr:hypothetical protein H4219_002473 [Mycoemilia scoparia]
MVLGIGNYVLKRRKRRKEEALLYSDFGGQLSRASTIAVPMEPAHLPQRDMRRCDSTETLADHRNVTNVYPGWYNS